MEFNKKDTKIFLIAGSARQGKTTSANIIKKYYDSRNKKSINIAIATPIKDYAKRITNWDGSDSTKPRELLQQLGTDLIRKEINNDFFINRTIEDIKVYNYFFDILTIDDIRFDLEIKDIKKVFNNIYVIHIIRPNTENILGDMKNHATEMGLTDESLFDSIIINDGSIDDLEKKIVTIMEGFYEC